MKKIFTICFILTSLFALAQSNYTLSGYVRDANTGETLISANVINAENPIEGTTTNTYGFYSITLPEGKYKIAFSYLGFQDQIFELDLTKNLELNVDMDEGVTMDEVVISAEKEAKRKNVESTQMGVIELPVENIKKLPAIFGEVDILKTIQLLPGVLSSGEGNAGFYVRGGGPDQNLVLLDEAVVYNSGHLLGFFSVFNADAIKNTTLIKGGMPANYGGRLSSVLDIQMKEGNNKKYAVEGGIGLISSRLTIQGPLVNEKSSFIVSGRRTYILDLAQPLLNGSDFEGTNYYFYDLNTKWNYRFSNKDRLYFSGYFGRDVFKFRQPKRDLFFDLPYGNKTGTLRWNHLFNDKLFFNLSAIYNDYNFQFDGGQEDFLFRVFSGVRDYNLKLDFEYYPNTVHKLKYGANYTYHKLTPNTASATNGEVDFSTEFLPKYANEIGLYILDDIRLNQKWSINAGLRYSIFSQIGPYTSKLTGEEYGTFESAITYTGWEPRFSFKYASSKDLSFKGGITWSNQYLHLVSNSSSTLPTDIWVPSTEIVEPQRGIQYAVGAFKNWKDDMYETSIEVYYKDLQNQIDYADNYVNDIAREVEDDFVFGEGRAYGAEFFVKKSSGRLNGWIGYTLSRSERSFPDIEDGRWYPTVYDRRHDLSIVANYELSKKWNVGGTFIYGSGRYFTPIQGFYFIEQELNTFYGPRNSAQLSDYHRFDISFTYTPKPDSKKAFKGSWTFSLYNTYNRKNPFFINYDTETDFESGTTTIKGEQITIFPLIPSITYNFKWNQK
ncbi:MAG: TonB-dependent receptor [Saprospiraceae bacterium]|nr:TonB-dependent receptor [Saprospiraceae bacterium]